MIFSKKLLLNKVYRDLMVNKARQTSSMNMKASDANELLYDNTTTLLRLIRSIGQIFLKKLGFLDKIFSKNNSIYFQQRL